MQISIVKNADRMMTKAQASAEGIVVAFADGSEGLVPYAAIPEVGGLSGLSRMELSSPYLMELEGQNGASVELPWDFVRAYCQPDYEAHTLAAATQGRRHLGIRVRELREKTGMTQDALASRARIGRVTLGRIERGEQSPRYETLQALAEALRRPFADLVTGSVPLSSA